MPTCETHALRSGDVVLAAPSPLTARRFHPAKSVDQPGAVPRTVKYAEPLEEGARTRRPSRYAVTFTDDTWATASRLATWVLTEGV